MYKNIVRKNSEWPKIADLNFSDNFPSERQVQIQNGQK